MECDVHLLDRSKSFLTLVIFIQPAKLDPLGVAASSLSSFDLIDDGSLKKPVEFPQQLLVFCCLPLWEFNPACLTYKS